MSLGGPGRPAPRLCPLPPEVPRRLLEAFDRLGVEPILVGGSAVQVWAGRKDGAFVTHDLDFLAPIGIADLAKEGLPFAGGRHIEVDGVPVEFPSGPLAVGDLLLSEKDDVVPIPTASNGQILCIRPEACVLDRLAWVAGDRLPTAYPQALGVALAQSRHPGWDWGWGDHAAEMAGLSKQWKHLREDIWSLEAGRPDPEAILKALRLGWG